jgi:ABC-type transport system substrate-binding protein
MGGTLKLIPHADLKVLDPIWTTAYITRNHGYMIYDTLFALDENLKVQPQQDGVRKKQLVEEIQKLAYEEVPYVAVGQSVYLIAYHDYVRGLPKFTAPVFWNVWLDKK